MSVENAQRMLSTTVTCAVCGDHFRPTIRMTTSKRKGELYWFKHRACGAKFELLRVTRRGMEIRDQLNQALAGWRASSGPDEPDEKPSFILTLEANLREHIVNLEGRQV